MSIQLEDVFIFLKKNKYVNTLELLQKESGKSLSTEPLYIKYKKARGDIDNLMNMSKMLVAGSDMKATGSEVKLAISLLQDIQSQMKQNHSVVSTRVQSVVELKPHPDSAKSVENKTFESSIPQPVVIQLKQVLDLCRKNKLDDHSAFEISEYLLASHKWSPTDAKILLAISRYAGVRHKLEPTLVLESLTSLFTSKPYTKRISLKALSYLSLNSQFAQDMATRNILDHFKFYTQENEDVEGLALLLLNLSEKSNYLVLKPVVTINLIMDVLEFGTEAAIAACLLTLHNIVQESEVRNLCQKLEIEYVLTSVATPKLNTAIDYVLLKLSDSKPKPFEYVPYDDDMNLDVTLNEDLALLISQ
eukprot:NODE_271_length_12205_cov_0.703205.p3 type:complete len:361 gc:universal NODE_271_length_12205_cov_0.703205:11892-10810(-)